MVLAGLTLENKLLYIRNLTEPWSSEGQRLSWDEDLEAKRQEGPNPRSPSEMANQQGSSVFSLGQALPLESGYE